MTFPCTNDPDSWFGESDADDAYAKKICQTRCDARLACYAGALERQEPAGVWGGVLFIGGSPAARRPQKGRPPKGGKAATPAAS